MIIKKLFNDIKISYLFSCAIDFNDTLKKYVDILLVEKEAIREN